MRWTPAFPSSEKPCASTRLSALFRSRSRSECSSCQLKRRTPVVTMFGTTRNQSKRMGSNRKDKVPSCLARCARTLSFTAARPGSKLQRRVQRRDLDKSLSVGPFHETCQGQLAIRSIYTAEAVCFSIKWMESKWPGRPWVFEKISSHSSHDRFGRDELCM